MYVVIEICEDYEQILSLVRQAGYPEDGILEWPDINKPKATVFASRKDARAAIDRTHHYAKAYGLENHLPDKKLCVIRPVVVEESRD